MANKTIHELTPASTVDSNYEIAVYDIDGNGTKKATADQILKTSSLLYAYDDDEPTGEVDFTSQDTTLTPSSSTSVDLLSGNDSWSQRFVKISQMFKNVRYLLSKLGTTDISSIGNGTVTNALSTLNNDLNLVTPDYNNTVLGNFSGNFKLVGLNDKNSNYNKPSFFQFTQTTKSNFQHIPTKLDEITTGTVIGYREVLWKTNIHILVIVTEFYPTPGRQHYCLYNNGNWSSWHYSNSTT